jgi:hypothetical protein
VATPAPPSPHQTEFDLEQRISLVCKYFCEGRLPSEIKDLMEERHGVRMSRETPYRDLSIAAKRGWLQYVAPSHHKLRDWLRDRYRWLQGLDVAHTATFDDVAYAAADMLLDLLRTYGRVQDRSAVHVGFAGGHVMRRVAQKLAQLLQQPIEGLPDTIVFHALVAGFNIDEPTTAPVAFFTYFAHDPAMQVNTRFVGFPGPPLVSKKQYEDFKKMEPHKEVFSRAADLDIIVTAASGWRPPCQHSMLRKLMEGTSLEQLTAAGCCGDMIWRPLGKDGPIEIETEMRAMTLVELSDLPSLFIDRGKAVLLVLGPCRLCYRPKTDILRTILDLEQHLITHLAVDSLAVAELMR